MMLVAANEGGRRRGSTGEAHLDSSSGATVPPGFRFHPTDEELLYYYLRKKVCYEPIDLDVIREVDLNKLEPWDLKDKCRIGSGPQNEWYFFSHKDKKYPTGTRTNRATAAGFWKATGRDKPIHHHHSSSDSNIKTIGMRKTLVFYIGRAPHGRKTDWIMHEYRLQDHHHHLLLLHNNAHLPPNTNIPHPHQEQLEDGWVVCRVFQKKSISSSGSITTTNNNNNNSRGTLGFQQVQADHVDINGDDQPPPNTTGNGTMMLMKQPTAHHDEDHQQQQQQPYDHYNSCNTLHNIHNMHLPQLLSPDQSMPSLSHLPQYPCSNSSSSSLVGVDDNILHNYCCNSQSYLLSLTASSGSYPISPGSALGDHWSFLDKLLTNSHQNLDQAAPAHDHQRFPFHHLSHHHHPGSGNNSFKFSK